MGVDNILVQSYLVVAARNQMNHICGTYLAYCTDVRCAYWLITLALGKYPKAKALHSVHQNGNSLVFDWIHTIFFPKKSIHWDVMRQMTAPPHEVGDLWSPCGYIIAFYRVLIVVLIRTRRTHSTLHERNHGSGFELSSDLYTQSRREIWKNQDAVKGKTFRSQLNSGDQWCAQVLHTTTQTQTRGVYYS